MTLGPRTAITVENLKKNYGDVQAVNDISFSVPEGSLFAFLGSNGAGKTTTISCLTTALAPSSGSLHVGGHNVITEGKQVRESIGVVFQQSLLDPVLTVRENLRLRARLYSMDKDSVDLRIAELSDLVSLGAFLDRPYGKLSGGQKRRADIARALIHAPDVVFLDEPTAGLDPKSREQIWAVINRLREDEGATVFLTTHYLEETEKADQVCVIEKGQIVARGTPSELRSAHTSSVLTMKVEGGGSQVLGLLKEQGLDAHVDNGSVVVRVDTPAQALAILNDFTPEDFEFRHGTMDDVFLGLTDREAP